VAHSGLATERDSSVMEFLVRRLSYSYMGSVCIDRHGINTLVVLATRSTSSPTILSVTAKAHRLWIHLR
jgi:hypothetical protein